MEYSSLIFFFYFVKHTMSSMYSSLAQNHYDNLQLNVRVLLSMRSISSCIS